MIFRPITAHDPKQGERVLLCNGVREWVTNYNVTMTDPALPYPATHFARYARPYPTIAEDRTNIRARDAYEIVRIAKKKLR